MGPTCAGAKKAFDVMRKVRHGVSYAADMPEDSASAVAAARDLQQRLSAAVKRLSDTWPSDWPPTP